MIKCFHYTYGCPSGEYVPLDIGFVLKKEKVFLLIYDRHTVIYLRNSILCQVANTDSSAFIAALWRLYRVRGGE